jgi:Protein of unknown function (DUF1569)
MQARTLDFRDFSSVAAELDRLHKGGYDKSGSWDLAQTCDHLRYFIEGSLDGHPYKVPWLLKMLFGRYVLKRILKLRRMRPNGPTPQKPLPAPGGDEAAAVSALKQALQRLETHPGEMHDSPFFGHLTPQQWRDLHMIHCAHHLAFLLPKGDGSTAQ